jgi:hypothetical protein
MYSFDTNVAAKLNIKNAIPPIITGLYLISSPDVVVAMPAINNIIGGGFISNFIQRNVAIIKEAAVTVQRFLK